MEDEFDKALNGASDEDDIVQRLVALEEEKIILHKELLALYSKSGMGILKSVQTLKIRENEIINKARYNTLEK